MMSVRMPSPAILSRQFPRTRAAIKSFAAICLQAASCLNPTLALLITLGLTFASAASAQTGHFVDAESLVTGGLENPFNVVVDGAGKIYIANSYANQILVETPGTDGYTISTIGTGLNSPQGVAVDQSGNVYIADTENFRVLKETLSGGAYTQSTVGSDLELPSAIAVDASGNLYITDEGWNKVFKETVSGSTYAQSTLFSGLNNPISIAVDASGNLYVADTNNNRVLKETRSGSNYVQSTIGSGLGSPGGVAVDQFGNVYIADAFPANIFKETLSGSTYTQSNFPVPSYLYSPSGIAVDASGNIYISDQDGMASNAQGRVLKEMPAGGNFGSVSVGTTSPEISLLFQFDTGGILGNVDVVTQGAENLDFINSGGLSCDPSFTFTAGETCATTVTLTPTVPGMRYGAVQLEDSSGYTFATGYVFGSGVGPEVNFKVSGVPSTQKTIHYSTSGQSSPYAVAVDSTGNIYISDSNNNRVLKETLSGGVYSESQVGSGLNSPAQIAVDGRGNLYIADTGNGRVVKESLNAGVYIQSVINNGYSSPSGVAVDGDGNVYIADTLNTRVLKMLLKGNSYTQTLLPSSGLSTVFGLAVDGAGNVYIVDTGNERVVKETPSGTSYTQSVVDTGLNDPFGIAVDGFGNLFITQFDASYILEEQPGAEGQYYPAVPPTTGLISPYGIAADSHGNVYVTDVSSEQVYKEDYADAPSLNFGSSDVGVASSTSPIYVDLMNIGNAPMYFPIPSTGTNPSVAANFTLDPTVPYACPLVPAGSMGASFLDPASACILSIGFKPTALGTLNGSLVVTDNSLYSAGPGYSKQSIALTGTGLVAPVPATMTSPTPSSTLTSSSATFDWTVGTGVTEYDLHVGTSSAGSSNIFAGVVTGTSKSVTGIPTTGGTLYVRLYSLINGAWQYNDYTYTEASPAVPATMTSPTPGSTLTSSSATFSWTTGTLVTQYDVHVGTTGAGSSNIFAGTVTTTSKTVTGIPTTGGTLNVRLYSLINGAWQYNDYTYTEASPAAPATMTSPTPGSTLTGSSATFTWTAGTGVTQYDLHVGTTGAGSSNIFGGTVTGQSKTVTGIPTTGGMLNVRLYSLINGVWQYNDYTYTEQ